MEKKKVSIIYTDGSCLNNPGGASGWCFYLLDEDGQEWIVSGGEPSSTNNRMELTAVAEALNFLQTDACTLFTDSMLTLNCATGRWKRKSNLDLWARFDQVSKGKTVDWQWVKAHNGDEYNELVDDLARTEAKNAKKIINIAD